MCRPGRDLGFYDTELGPIGLGICFDIWLNPELSRIFALKGARLIIAPTAGLRTSEHSAGDLRQMTFTRARENLVFVVMANLVGAPGDPSGSVYAGGSVIAGPRFPRMADILAEADDTETMAIATIDFAQYDKFAEVIPWREWRRTRNAAATEIIAREYRLLAEELAELESESS
jgi:predicted amidohydrolase